MSAVVISVSRIHDPSGPITGNGALMKFSFHHILIKSALSAAVLLNLISAAPADVKVYNETLKSTAWVLAKNGDSTSSGTGVIVNAEKKLLVTNLHVVGEARSAVIFFPETKNGKPVVDRQYYRDNVKTLGISGRVLTVDRKRDLALIELDRLPSGVQEIALAESSLGAGENIQSIGNPGSSGALWVFTSGTVRSVYQKQFSTEVGEHDFMVVETQSPINSGDSGGPVVNDKAELVAISQAISPKAQLISYSVDVSEVRTFLASDWKPAPLPIADVLNKADMRFRKTKDKDGILEVSLEQKDKQTQKVFVSDDVDTYQQADIRKIWSLAATLKEAPALETTTRLLRESAGTKMGAWSIEKSDAGDYLLIYVCKVDATCSPKTLKSTMEYVGKLTSEAKTSLTPKSDKEDPADLLNDWLSK